ncbi:NAD(P)-dependent oxidoreductase [Actimicrobium sp. CCI2.3]|uniref:NAD(P)-dependent oxidoreductase n=1 Tax=Actimicrobium sp. CCI2.3 TaxID=3048616 RepID=UPI002AB56CA7|nr:NAD(P)-dependent oxidoreductase [Actimicrobium sp. CCI2.3]MDY7573440.1 NAD(P)-dependent oxidoreductase [Actimicrobium sp. CCI2.3]MEB0022620.1 NAD(P)-dependent oxidoreductase [Actimicrobium sp. CCI2.3]
MTQHKNSPENLPCIAFLGTGLMGGPMADRLLKTGYRVTVWNRTTAKTDALVAAGATRAATPADAVAGAAIIITMLEAGPVVAEVIAAVIGAIAPGALVIDMSSTRQDEALALHAVLAARGIACLDAPVSGGVLGAQAGSLAIMVGGTVADFERALEVLQVMGRPTRVGQPGSGQVAKLCNQLIVGATLSVIAEALLLAQAAGADPVAVRQALRGGFAESRLLEVHGQRMLERDFRAGGQVRSQAKDLDNVLVAAADAGIALPLAALVQAAYRALPDALAGADQSAILLGLELANPGMRLGQQDDQVT